MAPSGHLIISGSIMKYAFAFLLAAITVTPAFSQNLGIGVRAGSLGPGADVSIGISSFLNIRVGGTTFSIAVPEATLEDENVDVEFSGDASLLTGSVMADLFPFQNGLRITVGATYNDSNVSVSGVPTDSYTVQARTFSQEEIGSLSAELGYEASIRPYAGIGFGNPTRGSRVGLLFDAGVVFSGPPTVSMSGTGMMAPTATENEDVIQEALDGLKIFPVVSLGLSIRL